MQIDPRVLGEREFSDLNMELGLGWHSAKSTSAHGRRVIVALGAVHRFWFERGTYPRGYLDEHGMPHMTPPPGPSSDPVDAAIYDANQAGQRWHWSGSRRAAAARSRDLVAAEDRAKYSATLGAITRRCREALELHEEAASAAS